MQKLSIKKIVIGYSSWWLMLIVLETYALVLTFSFPWHVALADTVNLNLLLATAGYITHTSLQYYRPSPQKGFYVIGWSIALAAVCTFLHQYLMLKLPISPSESYLGYIKNSTALRGLFSWLIITLMAATSWMWYYIQDQRASEALEYDAAKLAREAELFTLRQQLQPHFLFNSLNSISALVGLKPTEARLMIQQLSDFLRGTIKRDNQQLVTLREELAHLHLYLEIEKVRFGHRLNVVIEHEENASTMTLPNLLLQPIVENAIKFGLYDTIGVITISLHAQSENGYLVIAVKNPFDKQTTSPRSGTGFGLNSIQRRLYLLYARTDLLNTVQHENTFSTIIKIPQGV